MKSPKEIIPKKFWHASKDRPVIHTVGELKKVLDELPDELEIMADGEIGAAVVVFNISEWPHMELQDVDTWGPDE